MLSSVVEKIRKKEHNKADVLGYDDSDFRKSVHDRRRVRRNKREVNRELSKLYNIGEWDGEE